MKALVIVPAHILVTDVFDALQPSGSPPLALAWRDGLFVFTGQRGDRKATLRMASCIVDLIDITRPDVAPSRLNIGVLGAALVAQQVRGYLT